MAQPSPERSLTELDLVQNPALGAYALWQFGQGYQSHGSELAKLPAAFLVLPIILHRPTLEIVSSTQKESGLALFAAKLAEREENLLAVNTRALVLRHLTLRSLGFAINASLITLNYEDTTLRANTLLRKPKKPQIPERMRSLSNGAEKIGYWFAKMELPQIAFTLRVEF